MLFAGAECLILGAERLFPGVKCLFLGKKVTAAVCRSGWQCTSWAKRSHSPNARRNEFQNSTVVVQFAPGKRGALFDFAVPATMEVGCGTEGCGAELCCGMGGGRNGWGRDGTANRFIDWTCAAEDVDVQG
eukprot:1328115-Rhodomonas_salina.2